MVTFKGRKVTDIHVANIDTRDYPDFADAYIDYAVFEDGTELTEDELLELDEDGSIAHEFAYEQVF